MSGIFCRILRSFSFLCCIAPVCLLLLAGQAGAQNFVGPLYPNGSECAWVRMPAGARSAYIGIHGGTVPVSLLTARDGTSMVTFVGQTGNDFLRTLRRMDITPPPALQNPVTQGMASPDAPLAQPLPGSNATIIKADTPVGNIPVFYVTGKGFARMDLPQDQWLPFGLSETPLRLEGQAVKPLHLTKVKKYRHVLLPSRLKSTNLARR